MNLTQKRKVISDFLKKNTARGREKFPIEEEKEDVKLSTKAKNCKRIIENSDFGCRTKAVAMLISEVIGEKIIIDSDGDLEKDKIDCSSFQVVIDEENNILILGLASRDGQNHVTRGNIFDTVETYLVRFATDEEIDKAVSYIIDSKTAEGVFGFLF